MPCKHNWYWSTGNSIEKHLIVQPTPLTVTRLQKVLKETRGCLAMAASTFRLWTQLTHLPSPISYRPGTTNYIEQLYPTLWPPRKREETPPPAPASQTRERLIQDMALTWQGGREFRKLNGWMVKDLADFCTRINQRTHVHLQMHWARSMPPIKDNLILASLTFRRFSGWRWHIVLIVDTVLHAFASLRTCSSTSTKTEINCWALPRCWVL